MKPAPRKESNRFLSKWVWLGYLFLFAISIPWYWPADSDAVWLGLPVWVSITIISALAIAFMTSWLLLFHWPSDSSHSPPDNE